MPLLPTVPLALAAYLFVVRCCVRPHLGRAIDASRADLVGEARHLVPALGDRAAEPGAD